MNSLFSVGCADEVSDLLASLRDRRIRLWLDNGQIHYQAEKGTLRGTDKEKIKRHSAAIIAILSRAIAVEGTGVLAESHSALGHAPLAFSQLAHWNLYSLHSHPSVCLVSYETEIRGKLNIDALQRSIEAVVRRHGALRTRIAIVDGVPLQEIRESDQYDLKLVNLTTLPRDLREPEAKRLIEYYLCEPTNVCKDLLFKVRIIKCDPEEHLLVITMEHIIGDGQSMGIVVQDLFAGYSKAVLRQDYDLPSVPVQFSGYSAWQRRTHGAWVDKHQAHWNEHLKGSKRLRFPSTKNRATIRGFDWGLVRIQIGRELKAQLQDWCRLRRTTLVLGVFTAYVGLVFRWCKTPEAVFLYQTNGRVDPCVSRTVGYFSFPLYLRLMLKETDTFATLLNSITEEYCDATRHADFSYFESRLPRPEFTRNTCFNWMPQRSTVDLHDLSGSKEAIELFPVPVDQTVVRNFSKDTEPMLGLREVGDEVEGEFQFSLQTFDREEMQRFVDNFILFLQTLVAQPEIRLSSIPLS